MLRTSEAIATLTREPKHFGLGVVLIGTFLSVVAHSVAPVTLPSIATEFGSTLAEVQWVAIAVSLTTAVVVMPTAHLADRLGRKPFFTSGMVLFAATSILAGWSPSLGTLIAARLLQGVATAIVGANGVVIAVTLFPDSERGKVLGLISATVGFSALLAPAIGGVVVEAGGWRWAYHMLAVPAVIGAVGAWLILKAGLAHPATQHSRFDWIGTGSIAGTTSFLVLALTMGPVIDWNAPLVWGSAALALVLGATYVWWELHTPHPLFDLRLLTRRAVVTPLTTRIVFMMGFGPAGFLVPFYIQGVLGLSARDLGFILVPGFAVYTIVAVLAGRLSDRWTAQPFLVGAPLVGLAGVLILSTFGTDTSIAIVLLGLVIHTSALALLGSPSFSAMLAAVPSEVFSVSVGFVNLVGTVVGILGVALITAIVTAAMDRVGAEATVAAVASQTVASDAFLTGWRIAFFIQAIFMVAATAIGLKYRAPRQAHAS